MVLTLKVDSLVSYCEGPYEYKWIRLQVLRFVVNALVLGYKLGINSNAGESGMTCVLVYFRLCVAVCLRSTSTFLRMKTAWTSEGRYLYWWLQFATKGFVYSVLSACQRYEELYFNLKSLVTWCRLNADRGDCLCDRQVVGLDGICKLQWGGFFKSFYFLWTPSCVMAQMWRDRMQCRYVLGVCLITKVSVNVIWVSLCFC